jgi:hypothetical protein
MAPSARDSGALVAVVISSAFVGGSCVATEPCGNAIFESATARLFEIYASYDYSSLAPAIDVGRCDGG